ncbi:MAG: D-alanyl-D-alanine carboxypeptidase [Oscillospiraceae bacterium]|nr:D-alanyl-D-alanine carboxypeptidase [Oscillospiraceae bacterium]
MKKEKNSSGYTFALLIVILVAVFVIFFIFKFNDEKTIGEVRSNGSSSENSAVPADVIVDVTEAATEPSPELDFSEYELYSNYILLTDIEGNILYEKNSDERFYPASLTKIMTVIVALENLDDLDYSVQIPGYIYEYIAAEDASTAGFEAYDTVTVEDLLYGAILSSGAECCLTLADMISGTEYDFAALMNDKAEELGMDNTNFTNCTGLHNYDHYSSAEDISVLLRYALQNSEFRRIFTRDSYYTETQYNPYGIVLNSTMFSFVEDGYYPFELLGGKTGYTQEAGLCLASAAEINEKEYILVTAGADGSHMTDPYHIEDALAVYGRLADCMD